VSVVRIVSLALVVAGTAACTSGPGRTPIYPDAQPRPDRGVLDAEAYPDAFVRDAGFPDSAIELPDTGRPPDYPFTGIFSILGDRNKLFAREVQGSLHIVVGGHPYTYTGTITSSGRVDVVSGPLLRSGCPEARIFGDYERPASAFFLTHVTCNAEGQRVEGELRGGFDTDFDPFTSGVYELRVTGVADPFGCHSGPDDPGPLYYGFDVIAATNGLGVFTGRDLLPSTWYGGTIDTTNRDFAVTEYIYVAPSGIDVSIRGQIVLGELGRPPRVSMQRDAWDTARNCGFRMALEGERIAWP
jgi:hypothetical protein